MNTYEIRQAEQQFQIYFNGTYIKAFATQAEADAYVRRAKVEDAWAAAGGWKGGK